MKLRGSSKFALGLIAVVGVGWTGNFLYTKSKLASVNLNPIPKGRLMLMAIRPEAGVKLVVANRMAQIVEASTEFEGQGSDDGSGVTQGSIKKRIPVKELINLLNGEPDAVEAFITRMRDKDELLESANPPDWSEADVMAALGGDATKRAKLEADLNCKLDGTPLPTVNLRAFFDGIRVHVPITMNVPNAKGATISGTDAVYFRPRFMLQFYKSMEQKFYDKSKLQVYYTNFLKTYTDNFPAIDKSLVPALKRVLTGDEIQQITQIAANTVILANDSMITGAEMFEVREGGEVTYDLKIKLTKEAKDRLWKFSSEGGEKILVVADGVPIAAASIGTELASQELLIRQISDKSLLEEAVKLVQKL
jgi:hypothetical protein